ncbi:S1 family peptidase [Actinomadura syzygii]|uniref:S1 family peptidase n=1 Tax=Actinomadura syzygii TaxID=1427538 RepID=A0A5D0UAG3_9ACTN|nr:S1 family peptidase [Actinomadura syzygii]TYC15338.1 S1 family peptidase [Actinomadura syzygii]
MNRGAHLKRVVPLLGAALVSLPALGAVPATAAVQPAQPATPYMHAQTALADQLTSRLGDRQAGTYVDAAGNLVVNVTSKAAAKQVTDAGAVARVVKHGLKPLNAVKTRLDKFAGTPGAVGMVWNVDVVSNAVVVRVPQSDDDAATKALIKRARALGDAVQIKRVDGAPRVTLGPGDAILTGGSRCSVSAIGSGSGDVVITAGHCTNIGRSWTTSGGQQVGSTIAGTFPGHDYGFIRSSGQVQVTNANLTTVGRPPVGSQIQKKGSTTGTTSGSIKAYDVTVNYQEGDVTGLISTSACAQPGDSGGSLQGGSTAIGITSGIATSSCSGSGFESYFQPLDDALKSQNLTLKQG